MYITQRYLKNIHRRRLLLKMNSRRYSLLLSTPRAAARGRYEEREHGAHPCKLVGGERRWWWFNQSGERVWQAGNSIVINTWDRVQQSSSCVVQTQCGNCQLACEPLSISGYLATWDVHWSSVCNLNPLHWKEIMKYLSNPHALWWSPGTVPRWVRMPRSSSPTCSSSSSSHGEAVWLISG